MPMSREEFIRFIQPKQLQFMVEIVTEGLADYDDLSNYGTGARLAHHKSLRAQIRNAHIVHRGRIKAWEQPELGIRFKEKGNRPLFYFNELARVSFKKINENLRHSNYPTQQALDFDRQTWPDEPTEITDAQALWVGAGLPLAATNLVGGYLLNDAETEHVFYIVCPDGSGYAWYWPLTRADIIELITADNPVATAAAAKIQKRTLPMRVKKAKKGQEEAQ